MGSLLWPLYAGGQDYVIINIFKQIREKGGDRGWEENEMSGLSEQVRSERAAVIEIRTYRSLPHLPSDSKNAEVGLNPGPRAARPGLSPAASQLHQCHFILPLPFRGNGLTARAGRD